MEHLRDLEFDGFIQRTHELRYTTYLARENAKKLRESRALPDGSVWHIRRADKFAIFETVAERSEICVDSSDQRIMVSLSTAVIIAYGRAKWPEESADMILTNLWTYQALWIHDFKDHLLKLHNFGEFA